MLRAYSWLSACGPPLTGSVRFVEVADMIKSSLNVLDSYAEAFLDLMNANVWSSSKTMRELLRLNKVA
jgi:hypothetical protein